MNTVVPQGAVFGLAPFLIFNKGLPNENISMIGSYTGDAFFILSQ